MTVLAPIRPAWCDEFRPYPARLDALWAAHLEAPEKDAPTVISLFAGCGGSSLGYSAAGFRELLAVEWEAHACATLRLNFPGLPVHEGDVAALTEAQLGTTGLHPGDLDVLDGSPPCQGFSLGGKRRLDDPRNALFGEFTRLLRILRPRGFVMENVTGLVKGKMRLVFVEILGELKAAGYAVSARILDARYYGVPQTRQRVIFIGLRDDLTCPPSHPLPTATREIPLADAWLGVEPAEVPPLTPRYGAVAVRTRTGRSATHVWGFKDGKHSQTCKRERFDRPAYTVNSTNMASGFATALHPTLQRSLTIPECKRICSFPDQFTIAPAKFSTQWARLGNSVPPLFMAAIAAHVRGLVAT